MLFDWYLINFGSYVSGKAPGRVRAIWLRDSTGEGVLRCGGIENRLFFGFHVG